MKKNKQKRLYWGFTILVGVVLLLIAIIEKKPQSEMIRAIFIALSCSVFSSALLTWINEKFGENDIDRIVEKIDAMIDNKEFLLCEQDRKSIEKIGYYDQMYNQANHIKISGIMLSQVISYICQKKKHSAHWVLKLTQRSNVSVQLFLSHPESDCVKQFEALGNRNSGKKIRNSINELRGFASTTPPPLP